MNEQQLSLQQQRFCDEYLVSFNAYNAACNAGYSENTARKAELLHLPKIQAYLQQAMAKTSQRLQITHDMILRELAKVAFANMGDYYDEDGVLKPMNRLTANEKAAINQYQVLDAVNDEGQRIGELSKIKLHNKMAALDKIARHTGFYNALKESCELPVMGCGLDVEEESCELPVMGCGLDGEEESCELPVMGCGLDEEELEVVNEDTNNGEDAVINELDEKRFEKILTISPLLGKVTSGERLRMLPLREKRMESMRNSSVVNCV